MGGYDKKRTSLVNDERRGKIVEMNTETRHISGADVKAPTTVDLGDDKDKNCSRN